MLRLVGENRLYGGKGDDTLFAGVNDQLFGGNGDDILFARDNRLTGGDGKDQFWLVAGDIPGAANTITDFQSGNDVLGLCWSCLCQLRNYPSWQ